MIKTSVIGLRVTDDFKKSVEKLAALKGLSVSEYMRFLLMKELEKES